jgi:hypothetical protein
MRSVKLVGDESVHPDALQQMRDSGLTGVWFVYQNHALDHSQLGQLRFLCCGPERTFREPPDRYPDTKHGLGWPYVLVGQLELATGEITD